MYHFKCMFIKPTITDRRRPRKMPVNKKQARPVHMHMLYIYMNNQRAHIISSKQGQPTESDGRYTQRLFYTLGKHTRRKTHLYMCACVYSDDMHTQKPRLLFVCARAGISAAVGWRVRKNNTINARTNISEDVSQ